MNGYTIPEAAEELGVTVRTVHNYINRGVLSSRTVRVLVTAEGRKPWRMDQVRIPRRDVAEVAKARRRLRLGAEKQGSVTPVSA